MCNYSTSGTQQERERFIHFQWKQYSILNVHTLRATLKKARTHIIVQIYKLVSLELFFGVSLSLAHTHSISLSVTLHRCASFSLSFSAFFSLLCLCVTLFHSLIGNLVVHRFTSFHSKFVRYDAVFFVDSTDSHPGLSNREEKKWFSYYDYLNTLQQQHSHKIFSTRNHRAQQIKPSKKSNKIIRFSRMISRNYLSNCKTIFFSIFGKIFHNDDGVDTQMCRVS